MKYNITVQSGGEAIMKDHLEIHELAIAVPLNIDPLLQIVLVQLLKIGRDVLD
jgi:hypothetical protein